jgi:formate transporter
MFEPVSLDALLPPAMAAKAEQIGVKKAGMAAMPMFLLAILAGAFIALGAGFMTTAVAGTTGIVPYGVVRVLGGAVFSLGLILVVVGGAELFTGNNLIVMAWASGRERPSA